MKTPNLNKKTAVTLSIIFILSAGAIGCGGSQGHSRPNSQGQGQPPSKEQLFMKFDKDNDGKLSKEEFPGPDNHFTQFDKNSDGYLEKDEMPDGPPPKNKRK